MKNLAILFRVITLGLAIIFVISLIHNGNSGVSLGLGLVLLLSAMISQYFMKKSK